MAVEILSPAPKVPADYFLERLNAKKTSRLVETFAREYATTGSLSDLLKWSDADVEQIRKDLSVYPFVEFILKAFARQQIIQELRARPGGFPHEKRAKDRARRGVWKIADFSTAPIQPALDWLALFGLVQDGIRLGICPEPDCHRFFVDAKNRGKSACSPEHANRQRQRAHFERLKTQPRKYRAYKKKQAALMRARRKAGLA